MKKAWKITTKLYMVFFGVAIVFAIYAVGTNQSTGLVYGKYEKVISTYDAVNLDLKEIRGDYRLAEIRMIELLSSEEVIVEKCEETSADINGILEEIDEHEDYMKKIMKSTDYEDDVEELIELFANQNKTISTIMEYAQDGKMTEAMDAYINKFVSQAEELDEKNEALAAVCEEMSEQCATEAYVRKTKIATVNLLVAGIVIAVMLLLSYTAIRDIRIPIKNMMVAVKKLRKGDVDVEIPTLKADELGILSQALNELAAKERKTADVAKLVSGGDMTVSVIPESTEDVLGNAMKLLVEENNSTLTDIREASVQVGAGSRQVAMASQSLAQGSTEQASALQQVTASISDITSKTKMNAENATEANNLVRDAKENAEEGNVEMANMVSAMKDINESSENISKIIKTIDDIAFQTNILALNAAVEAARAGEHGKGFAVVAEEVRSLAAKSAEAASETAEMIEDSIQKVQNGSQLAEKTAGKLGEIVSAVDNIVTLIDGIAAASNDQASALMQIDQAVMQVSQVVQTNSATSEQCAAASEELSNQAKNLEQLVGRYRLHSTKGSTAAYLEAGANDSFGMGGFVGMTSAGTDYSSNTFGGAAIPDASDFADMENEAQNEKIISLEDNMYSKY